MNNIDESKQMAYFILQHKYLQMLGKEGLSEQEIVLESNKLFPENWAISYDVDRRIELLSKALGKNSNILDILSNEKDNRFEK